MRIYTFQSRSLLDIINENGIALVSFPHTNLFKQTGGQPSYMTEAYFWMATKLAQKTGMWLKELYGPDLPEPKDADGDYVNEAGEKLPPLPFWGWYLVDSKNQKPDESYSFGNGDDLLDWNKNADTVLITLDVPDHLVLLSDANAWYCALEGRPCYEYEKESIEAKKLAAFERLTDPDEIWRELSGSWENIFRLEGRRLRSFMGMPEKKDVQAVFPMIRKEWIVETELLP